MHKDPQRWPLRLHVSTRDLICITVGQYALTHNHRTLLLCYPNHSPTVTEPTFIEADKEGLWSTEWEITRPQAWPRLLHGRYVHRSLQPLCRVLPALQHSVGSAGDVSCGATVPCSTLTPSQMGSGKEILMSKKGFEPMVSFVSKMSVPF